MTERAPDLAGPILGWRVWRIAVDGELVSAYTPAGWPSRAPIVARCYEQPGDARGAGGAVRVRRLRLRRRARGAVLRAPLRLGRGRPHQALGPRRRARGGLAGGARVSGVDLRAARAVPRRGRRRRRASRAPLRRAGVRGRRAPERAARPGSGGGRAARHPDAPPAGWIARRVRPQPLAEAREAAAAAAASRPRRRQAGTGSSAGCSAGGAEGASSGSGAGTGSSTGSTTITRCGSPISTRRC